MPQPHLGRALALALTCLAQLGPKPSSELRPLSSRAHVSGLMLNWGHRPQCMASPPEPCLPTSRSGAHALLLSLTGSQSCTSLALTESPTQCGKGEVGPALVGVGWGGGSVPQE